MKKLFLNALTLEELKKLVRSENLPDFRAKQIQEWIYRKYTVNLSEMTNLSKDIREKLSQTAAVTSLQLAEKVADSEGTTKLLLALADGETIEMVLIPSESRMTFCLSTQVGCPVGCKFCASGRYGLTRNLSAEEILSEFLIGCSEIGRLPDNVVFMGIGEGLLNFENLRKAIEFMSSSDYYGLGIRRITVSTSGYIPGIRKLADWGRELTLAISLHAPNDEVRSRIIPDKLRAGVAEIMEASDYYLSKCNRMVTLEYTLLDGINDHREHAEELAILAKKHHNKVNLIPYNDTESEYKRPSQKKINEFAEVLHRKGVTVTIRQSKGNDKISACGQLRSRRMEIKN
ncbi:MAG: 23S rRNA (adenine(2503)-C(2))-methyltransferase RlmN [Lentisphaeria bacterium]|nr:23S rRNA (adenine(2503)-C(2))-methyltransferase RlmN [Lentisphaeria bacterium]